MKVYHDKFEIKTSKRIEAIDITEKVETVVDKSKVENGICLIFVPHATAAIVLEEAESGLMSDIEVAIQKIFPKEAGYKHDRIDDNASSHIASGLIGQSRVYPIKDGEIVKGVWQQTFLIELDGPRRREVVITVIGE
jgi:secondary thiamine-phosphate synthase enzyme